MSRKTLAHPVLVALALCFLAAPAFSLEVDEPEIQSVAGDTVEFINYNGPHAVVNTLDQIKSIGTGLGTVIAPNPETSATAGNQNRYYVIHAVDPAATTGLDADILIIGPDASVDHIRNLRYIIAGYLVSAYGYTEADADTLAVFVTVYNAVHRGDLEFFRTKYKPVVMEHLTADKAGLSLNYQEWPGKSQIVIPLAATTGGLGTVDTTSISDREVIDSMREEDDMGIDDRKDLVDIKDREAEQAEEKAAQAQQEAAQAEAQLREEQQALRDAQQEAQQAQQQAQQAQQEAQQAQQQAAQNPDDQEAQQKADEAQQKADEAQQKADEAQQTVEEQKEAVEEQKELVEEKQQEAAEQQEIADQKREEARDDRAEIAKDQQQLLREGRLSTSDGVYGLQYIDDTFSVMVKLDKANGSLLDKSPVASIRSRTLLPAGQNYMAVAGSNAGRGAVKLVLLDTLNMEIVAESTEVAADKSVLVQDGQSYYAVIQDGGNWVVGKYDSQLQLQAKSQLAVNPATPISLTESGLIVTDSAGAPKLLKYSDLSEASPSNAATAGGSDK